MKRMLLLSLCLGVGLVACGSPTGAPPPPDPNPSPSNPTVATTFDTWEDLQAFTQNITSTDPAVRTSQLNALFHPVTASALSLPDELAPYLQTRDATVQGLQLSMVGGMGLTLDSWAAQASAFGFTLADGRPLTATAVEDRLAAIRAQPTFTREQRPLALVVALWQARGAPSDGHAIGDGFLDPMQVYVLNNVLFMKAIEAQDARLTALDGPDDPLAGLKIFKDLYDTGKQFLGDGVKVAGGVLEFGNYTDCVTYLTTGMVVRVTAQRPDIWRNGLGQPFTNTVKATALMRENISDADLVFHAQNGCAPTANRTFAGVKMHWLLQNTDEGTVDQSEGTTDGSGQTSTTFTAIDDTSPPENHIPSKQKTDAVQVAVGATQLSGKYPLLEFHAISTQQQVNDGGLFGQAKFNVSYYDSGVDGWKVTFTKKVIRKHQTSCIASTSGGVLNRPDLTETTTGTAYFFYDPKRSNTVASWYASAYADARTTFGDTGAASFDAGNFGPQRVTLDGSSTGLVMLAQGQTSKVKYVMTAIMTDPMHAPQYTSHWTCPNDIMTYELPRPKVDPDTLSILDEQTVDMADYKDGVGFSGYDYWVEAYGTAEERDYSVSWTMKKISK